MAGARVVTFSGTRPSVAGAAWPLAILYAIGAYWIVYSLAVGVFAVSSFFVQLPVSPLYLPSAVFAGSAAAIAVAFRSGGWLSALGLCAAGVAYALIRECQSDTALLGSCTVDLGGTVQGHIAEAVGALAGVPLALGLRRRDGRSALLLAASIFAIAFAVLRVGFALFEPVTGPPAYERSLWATGLQAAAALAAGAVLGSMARSRTWALLTIGAAFLLPWLGGTFHQWWENEMALREHGFRMSIADTVRTQWQLFLPLIYFVLVLIGAGAASAVGLAARRFKKVAAPDVQPGPG